MLMRARVAHSDPHYRLVRSPLLSEYASLNSIGTIYSVRGILGEPPQRNLTRPPSAASPQRNLVRPQTLAPSLSMVGRFEVNTPAVWSAEASR